MSSSASSPSYDQPTKKLARLQSLQHAVELLTTRREDAAIVPGDHPSRIKASLATSDTRGDAFAAEECSDADIASWETFRASSIGTRSAAELTVAYLAGPEPTNDLKALIDLGLRPENIWAFETDVAAIAKGVADLEAIGLRGVKFVPVSMDAYLVGTPRRFDIIYVDACGPLPSDAQRTTRLVVDIFRHGALAPLGVLITNFSRPDISKAHTLDTYSALVAAYLYPKGFTERDGAMIEGPVAYGFLLKNDETPEVCFTTEVMNDFDAHYGAFITRHVMDIAEIIAPVTRLASSGLQKVLFSEDLEAAAARGRRFVRFNEAALAVPDNACSDGAVEHIPLDGDAISDSSFFTLIWTLAALGFYEIDVNFDEPSDAVRKFATKWKNQLSGSPALAKMEDVLAAFYAWRHDQSLWSPAMQELGAFPYRDIMPFLCDVPTEEIGFYPAFAQLAYPAHPNIRETRRFRYVAEGKVTPMFLDVIAFDECRYVYDWLSALHLVTNDWFDLSAQLTFRFALDAIVKERRWMGDDFLYGCHVVGESSEFPTAELGPRIDLNASAQLG